MYFFLIYEIIKFILPNIIVKIVMIVFSILCKIHEKSLKKLNCRIISIWNDRSDKSVTLRCTFLVLFNLSFYVIYKLLMYK